MKGILIGLEPDLYFLFLVTLFIQIINFVKFIDIFIYLNYKFLCLVI